MTTNSPSPVDGDVQALIEQCKDNIETLTVAFKHCDQEEADEIYRNLELQKVALAALTAVPKEIKYRERNPATNCVTSWEVIDSLLYRELIKVKDPETAEFELTYTTPPAQLLRPVELPDCVDDLHGVGPVMSADAVVEALRHQGYEVKND